MLQSKALPLANLLRDPMLRFVVIGTAIFATYAIVQPPHTSTNEIVVSEADLALVTEQYRQTWRSEPSSTDLAMLIDNLVLDEVLYREALALGLDQGDQIIRQRLRQKLEFILLAAAEVIPPTEAELRVWFEANVERFASPLSLKFDQVMLDDAADAKRVLTALAAGADPEGVGRPTQLPLTVQAVAPAVDANFGPGFSDAVADLPPGKWAGPVKSAYGLHLVMVIDLQRKEADFASLRDTVEADWRRDALQRAINEIHSAMRANYVIRIPGDALE